MRISSTISGKGRPRARLAAQIARYSKMPVSRITPTMIIMPRSRKTTFQSTPVSVGEEGRFGVADPEREHQRGTAQRGGDPA